MLRPALASSLIALVSVGCAVEDIASTTSPVVYDDDDRIEVYEETDAARRDRAKRSIVALIPRENVITGINGYAIDPNVDTLNDFIMGSSPHLPLCADQRFRDQPAAGNCSGTLIDDDLVLTAGHCVDSLSACRSQLFVFDYYYESDGELAALDNDDVYECDRVVAYREDRSPPFLDFAIVKLTRAVVGDREPAPIDPTNDALASGTSVTVMGFGSGLPLKIDAGGEVLSSNAGLTSFLATTDTFGGNSGSGVFDAAGNVVGILVAGQQDYLANAGQGCVRVNVLDPDTDSPVGETITYVHRAIEALCEDEYPSELLCDITPVCGDGICSGTETLANCEEDCDVTRPPGGKKGRCSVSTPGRSGSDGEGYGGAILLSFVVLTAIRRRATRR